MEILTVRSLFLGCFLCILLFLVYILQPEAVTNFRRLLPGGTERFSNDVVDFESYKRHCYPNGAPSKISDVNNLKLDGKAAPLCAKASQLLHSMYYIYSRYANIIVSDSFMKKLQRWFPGRKDLIDATKNQTLIFINNKYSYENIVFNLVRESRPVASVLEGDTLTYVNKLSNASFESCPYCSYKVNTATDDLGRMESQHAVITSSTFKIDKYHSIAILKRHHPLSFTQAEFIDCMDLIMKWYRKVHEMTPAYQYRVAYWDILPKAGATEVHPGIHITIGDTLYHSRWNRLHRAAVDFSRAQGGLNYWKSLLQIHTLLGLTYKFGDATVLGYINPQKDAESLIISEKPCLDFFRLIFFTLRAYFDDLKLYALSMSIVFPKFDSAGSDDLPVVFRVVSRGSADSSRSDIGSFAFFGGVNVNRDPYKLIKVIKNSVKKQQVEAFDREWIH